MKIRRCGVHNVFEFCDLDCDCPFTMLYYLNEFEKIWKYGKYGVFIREEVPYEKLAAFFRLTQNELVTFIVTKYEVMGDCPNAQEIRDIFFVQ